MWGPLPKMRWIFSCAGEGWKRKAQPALLLPPPAKAGGGSGWGAPSSTEDHHALPAQRHRHPTGAPDHDRLAGVAVARRGELDVDAPAAHRQVEVVRDH